MKKYDKKEIMRAAWRTYKFVTKKKGQSFGETLKATWRLAKVQHALKSMEENKPAKAKTEVVVKKAEAYNWGCFTAEDIYPSSRSGKYCAD